MKVAEAELGHGPAEVLSSFTVKKLLWCESRAQPLPAKVLLATILCFKSSLSKNPTDLPKRNTRSVETPVQLYEEPNKPGSPNLKQINGAGSPSLQEESPALLDWCGTHDSTFTCVSVFVRYNLGPSVPVELQDSSSVAELKEVVGSQQGVCPEELRVLFAGRELQSCTSLQVSSCHVLDDVKAFIIMLILSER